MIQVRVATTQADFDLARGHITSFVGWLKALYPNGTAAVDDYFKSIQPEMQGLPGEYGPPGGCLLLATVDDEPAGLVALRRLTNDVCEMKRMFVDASLHGKGVGYALAARLLVEAQELGYTRMRLETSTRQVAALGLYRRLGFAEIEPYYEVAAHLRPALVFMEVAVNALNPQPGSAA